MIYLKKKSILKKKNFYLILSFKNKKIFINLQNKKKKNLFFLSSGMFIKFFSKKKSLKKSKNIKLLMAKFLRKLYFLLKIKNTIMLIKNSPLHLNDFLIYFNSPLLNKFPNPEGEDKFFEEKSSLKPLFKITNFFFLKNFNFSKNKIKKKGRIKRKITRKLISFNKIVD